MTTPHASAFHDQLQSALGASYVLERELGRGGMATVFLATDVRHQRRVAVKLLHPELAATIGVERFLAEIRLAARLQHPHILGLIDSGEAAGLVYYVMPFVDGESLRDRLARERQLPVADAVRIAQEVASALDYAHRNGVIHRDIKPENILLQDGQALVADFGIALAVTAAGGQRLTQTGLSLGTPQYMSPEQAMGERTIDARSDVYALGAVMYEMLTGEPPFTGPSVQAIVQRLMHEEPRAISAQRRSVPLVLEQATFRALEKLPADRWTSAAAFSDAIAGSIAPSRAPSATYHPSREPHRPLSAYLVPFATFAVGAALGFAVARLRTPSGAIAASARMVRLTHGGRVGCAAISPDGQRVAMVVGSFNDESRCGGQLVLQPVPGGRATTILGDVRHVVAITWSADGQALLFVASIAGGPFGLYLLPTEGGAPRLIGEPGARFGFVDRRTVYVARGVDRYDLLDVESGAVRDSVRVPDEWAFRRVAWSPDGKHVLAEATRAGTTYLALTDATLRITDTVRYDGRQAIWAGPSQVAYHRTGSRGASGDLMVRDVDAARGRFARTEPHAYAGVRPVLDLSSDAEGRRIVFADRDVVDASNTAQLDRAPVATRELVRSVGAYLGEPLVSPSGDRVAYMRLDALGYNIYWQPFAGGAETSVTADTVGHGRVDWRDEHTLVITQSPPGASLVDLSTGRVRTLDKAVGALAFVGALAGGDLLWSDAAARQLLVSDSLGRARRRIPAVRDGAEIGQARVAPDGRTVIVSAQPIGAGERWLYEWTPASDTWRRFATIAADPTLELVAATAGWAYYARGDDSTEIWRIPSAGGAAERRTTLPVHCYLGSISLSADGTRFVCNVTTNSPDAWMLDRDEQKR